MIGSLIYHFEYFVAKYWLVITAFISLLFLLGTIFLFFDFGWGKEAAESFRDNVIIEACVGGLFLFIPIIVGVILGKKIKEIRFYENIQRILDKIKILRKSGSVVPESARDIVKEISKTMGSEILEESWFKRQYELPTIVDKEKDCGVCGLIAQTTEDNKCKNCNLNCFAWDK